ncbi:MAG: acyltransferase domain-containing protein [Elusimicrobia bacterium]|nr:acyltransferase domain-containing protein [Elusimicrobiota bacterium]
MGSIESDSAIAIIGMAGRFPGAKNVDEFWRNLRDGKETISILSDEELLADGETRERLSNPNYVKAGGILEDSDQFDAAFFDIPEEEARMMDPQHRLLLECAWNALEDAGVDPRRYPGLISIYAGVGREAYLATHLREFSDPVKALEFAAKNDKDYAVTRVSYKLNLRGSSMLLQSASSTSLVAVHMACQNLLNGESDVALAGGVSLHTLGKRGYFRYEGTIRSPDGHCRSFDAGANGTVPSSGVGIVVLRRLADAIADGDPIHAVIRGSAVNNDGSAKLGFTTPSVEGQAAVMAEALAVAQVEPETVTYIEAHGTATPLGDPVEISAMTQAYAAEGTATPGRCAIGALKPNIGHCYVAAGVASLMKAVLSLKHRTLAPSLHFAKPNPNIDFAKSPFYVNTARKQWDTGGAPRRAGVSAFGMGGTNAHVILEEAPDTEQKPEQKAADAFILPLSARTPAGLAELARATDAWASSEPSFALGDMCYSAAVRRAHHEQRIAAVFGSRESLSEQLRAYARGENLPDLPSGRKDSVGVPKLAFVFSSRAKDTWDSGRELMAKEPTFLSVVQECDRALKRYASWSLAEEMRAEGAKSRMGQTEIAQPAMFALQAGLVAVLRQWGIAPQAIVGHSIGEMAAAYVSGALTLEEGIAVAFHRGRVMQRTTGQGGMLAVGLPSGEVQEILRGREGKVSIAAVNSPRSVVLSGEPGALQALAASLEAKKIFVRMLKVNYAFHDHHMDPHVGDLEKALEGLKPKAPKIPIFSTLHGRMGGEKDFDGKYWARETRESVLFASAMEQMIGRGFNLFLEIGPHPVLSVDIGHCLDAQKRPGAPLVSLRQGVPDTTAILHALGNLYVKGFPVAWEKVYASGRLLSMPGYPWQRKSYRIGDAPGAANAAPAPTRLEASESLSRETDPGKRRAMLEEYLSTTVGKVLNSKTRVDRKVSLLKLGVDSLMAVRLKGQIEADLQITVALVDLLKGFDIEQLAGRLEKSRAGATNGTASHGPAATPPGPQPLTEQERAYPLSHGQQGLWFQHQLAPKAYNNPVVLRVRAALDAAKLRTVLEALVDRHESLRVTFAAQDGKLTQEIHDRVEVPYREQDASGWSDERLDQELKAESNFTFQLEQGPVFRAAAFVRGPADFYLLMNMPHIIFDGVSKGVLVEEFAALYAATGDPRSVLPPPQGRFSGFVKYQKDLLESPDGARMLAYWKRRLGGELPVLNLPADFPRPPVQSDNGSRYTFSVDGPVVERLKALADAESATLFMVFLAAFQAFLSRHAGQEDIIVGSSMTGEGRRRFPRVLGYFINMVPLRTDLSGDPEFKTLLDRTKATVLEAIENQEYPISLLAQQLKTFPDPAFAPIFQSSFTYHKRSSFLSASTLEQTGLDVSRYDIQQGAGQYDLNLRVSEGNDSISLALQYNSDLFGEASIARMAESFQALLRAIAGDARCRPSSVAMPSASSRRPKASDRRFPVRGYHVDLMSIESALNQVPGVTGSRVIPWSGLPAGKFFAAYVVPAAAPADAELVASLRAKLPQFMIPAAFTRIDRLPTTSSGDVDETRLPPPVLASAAVKHEAPRNETEELLAKVWAQTLRLKEVGIHSKLFELGGDSITALHIVMKLNQAGVNLTLAQIYQHQTIAALAELARSSVSQAEQGPVTGPVPLTPIQHWFFDQNPADPNHYNSMSLWETSEELEVPLLERTVWYLLGHHDALRLRCVLEGSEWKQRFADPDESAPFVHVELAKKEPAEQEKIRDQKMREMAGSMNLAQGPIVRTALFDYGPSRPSRFVFMVHHLAVDAVSMEILRQDFNTAYRQLSNGEDVKLPAKTASFKVCAQKILEVDAGKEKSYWLSAARKVVQPIPADFPDGPNSIERSHTVWSELENGVTSALVTEAPKVLRAEINDVLLAALLLTFRRWTGKSSLLIDMHGHGRDASAGDSNIARTVGWYGNLFPLLLDVEGCADLEAAASRVKRQIAEIPNHGMGYGLLRYLSRDLETREQLRKMPQAEVRFDYMGRREKPVGDSGCFQPTWEPGRIGPLRANGGNLTSSIVIYARVLEGRFQTAWVYSEGRYKRETIETLARRYADELRAIADRCRSTAGAR